MRRCFVRFDLPALGLLPNIEPQEDGTRAQQPADDDKQENEHQYRREVERVPNR